MSLRKVFSIIIASLAVLLFIFMFIPYVGNDYYKANLWKIGTPFGIFALISYLAIIAVHGLSIFGIIKEKWMHFVDYAVGYVGISHLVFLFNWMDMTRVGIWFATIFALGLLVLSVLWYFMSDKPFSEGKAKTAGGKVTGYDPKTGKPIFAQPKGFDPQTGEPIYE